MVESRCAMTIDVRPAHQDLERPLDEELRLGVERATSPRRG
jgi:hypothetical protein